MRGPFETVTAYETEHHVSASDAIYEVWQFLSFEEAEDQYFTVITADLNVDDVGDYFVTLVIER